MRVLYFLPFAFSILLAGCVAQADTVPEEPKIWGRADCQRVEGNPIIQQEAERVRALCVAKAEAAAVSGTTAIPVGNGIAGGMMSGIQRGMAQNQIATATLASCMGENGWMFKTRSEHEAMCAAIKEQKRADNITQKRNPPPLPRH